MVMQKDILSTPNRTNEASSHTQTEATVHQNAPNNNQYDEIEEF